MSTFAPPNHSNDAALRRRKWRTRQDRMFVALAMCATLISVIALAVLLTSIFFQGKSRLDELKLDNAKAAMEPQPATRFSELGQVDWSAVSESMADPSMARLGEIDWSQAREHAETMFVDSLGDFEFELIAEKQSLADFPLIDNDRWVEIMASATVPGMGWLEAHWKSSEFGQFVSSPPSRFPEKAGIGPAMWGTLFICMVCALSALPLGVGTAVFLEEFKPRHLLVLRVQNVIQLNISNLAGVPSIVYGVIGLTAFVHFFGIDAFGTPNDPAIEIGSPDDWFYFQIPFGRGVFAGGLTLMLVILPIVIISAQEALRAVPDSLRQGALATGATRWQMIKRMTLPAAIPGIMTGAILAMSRAVGEAAPVLIICGIVFIRFTPANIMDEFTAMPLQIYDWAGRPQADFHTTAAAGIMILLAILLSFNALAIFVRQKFHKPLQ